MDPPTAAEAEEGALEFRDNDAFLKEHQLQLDLSDGIQFKSNFRATAQRIYKVLKAIPEDRDNKEQWAIAKALWKEFSDIDPAMPSWDNIRKPTIYRIDEKVDAQFRVKGQEVIVIEDIQPRFKKEMLDNKPKPKTKAEFKQLARTFGDKYCVKKGVLDLLITANSATAPCSAAAAGFGFRAAGSRTAGASRPRPSLFERIARASCAPSVHSEPASCGPASCRSRLWRPHSNRDFVADSTGPARCHELH